MWATMLVAAVVLALDAYLLYGFYAEPEIPGAKTVKVGTVEVANQVTKRDGAAAEKEAAGYADRVGRLQAGSVETFLDSNDRLLRYDDLTAADIEALEANYLALRDFRERADELVPPEKYQEQYEAFGFALGDLHYAAELAHRLAADPVSATQSDFGAYALHADRAAEHLRRSNEILNREFETTEGARTPTVR